MLLTVREISFLLYRWGRAVVALRIDQVVDSLIGCFKRIMQIIFNHVIVMPHECCYNVARCALRTNNWSLNFIRKSNFRNVNGPLKPASIFGKTNIDDRVKVSKICRYRRKLRTSVEVILAINCAWFILIIIKMLFCSALGPTPKARVRSHGPWKQLAKILVSRCYRLPAASQALIPYTLINSREPMASTEIKT